MEGDGPKRARRGGRGRARRLAGGAARGRRGQAGAGRGARGCGTRTRGVNAFFISWSVTCTCTVYVPESEWLFRGHFGARFHATVRSTMPLLGTFFPSDFLDLYTVVDG